MHKFLISVSIVCFIAGSAQADIFAVGDLPGGDFVSLIRAISANGTFVVGDSSSGNGPEAFLWSLSTGMVGLGDLPGGSFSSRAYGVSADGAVVVGEGDHLGGGYGEAFRWTPSGGMVGLGSLPGSCCSSASGGVSSDGLVVMGKFWEPGGPFLWTQSGGMVELSNWRGSHFTELSPRSMSGDGSTAVGIAHNTDGNSEAVRWTQTDGTIGLGDLPGGEFWSQAWGASFDGSIVVGGSRVRNDSPKSDAFVWTASAGMVRLWARGTARGLSADGSIIVGHAGYAVIWTEADGMLPLADVLTAQGDDLSHWASLQLAHCISADGSTIAGYGTNVNGDTEAFVATLISDVTAVAPNSLSVTRGTYISGGLVELAESDNADLSLQRATSDVQSRTELEVKAISPVASPSSLEVTLEGSVFARSTVNQTIELFDYVAGGWVQVDTRAATRFTDSTVTVAAAGDLSRFVEPETMCIEARIRYQSPVARQQFSSNTDQFIWTIGQ